MKTTRNLMVLLSIAGLGGCEKENPPAAPKSGGGTTTPPAVTNSNPHATSGGAAVKPAVVGAKSEHGARLESAYRQDNVAAGLVAAHNVLSAKTPDPHDVGLAVRALFRAGELRAAFDALQSLADASKGETPLLLTGARVVRAMVSDPALAEQSLDAAVKLTPDDPEVLNELIAVRIEQNRLADAAKLAEALDKALEKVQGHPGDTLKVHNTGRAAFLKNVGDKRLNAFAKVGVSPFKWAPEDDFQRPFIVETTINGKGPYVLSIDTVGGDTLNLRPSLAEAAGVAPGADAQVLTLEGPKPAKWALTDALEFGDNRIERVITRIYDDPARPVNRYDGSIGLGLFKGQRLTLDLADWKLTVGPSGPFTETGPEIGIEPLYYVGDNRVVFPTEVEGRRKLSTIGSYISVTTISESLLLEVTKPTDVKDIQSPFPGIGSEEGMQTVRYGADGFLTFFGGRNVPMIIAVSVPFKDALIDKLAGTHVDVILAHDISPRMKRLAFDGPARKMLVEWYPVPDEAQAEHAGEGPKEATTQPAPAPAPAPGK